MPKHRHQLTLDSLTGWNKEVKRVNIVPWCMHSSLLPNTDIDEIFHSHSQLWKLYPAHSRMQLFIASNGLNHFNFLLTAYQTHHPATSLYVVSRFDCHPPPFPKLLGIIVVTNTHTHTHTQASFTNIMICCNDNHIYYYWLTQSWRWERISMGRDHCLAEPLFTSLLNPNILTIQLGHRRLRSVLIYAKKWSAGFWAARV